MRTKKGVVGFIEGMNSAEPIENKQLNGFIKEVTKGFKMTPDDGYKKPVKYIGTKIITASPLMKDSVDGYEVVYEDGYKSWSPKDVFEKAYRRCDKLNFGLAVEAAKKGKKIARMGWNGTGMWVAVQNPDENSKMLAPYLYMKPRDGKLIPWLASQADMLSDDWFILEA